MPDTSGPFDSATWAEADWYRTMVNTVPSGIHGATPASSFSTGSLAFASTGLVITPAAGRATVGGSGYVRTAALTSVTVTANSHATFSRRDRIVLRRSLATHNVVLALITGTPASTPVAPSITRDDTTWDLPLFSFLVPPASGTTISGVQDERLWVSPYEPGKTPVAVADATVRNALSQAGTLTPGNRVYQSSNGCSYDWTGTVWRKVAGPLGVVLSSLNSAGWNTNPGQILAFTDFGQFTVDAAGTLHFSVSTSVFWSASGNTAMYYSVLLTDSTGNVNTPLGMWPPSPSAGLRFHNNSTGGVNQSFTVAGSFDLAASGTYRLAWCVNNDPLSASAFNSININYTGWF